MKKNHLTGTKIYRKIISSLGIVCLIISCTHGAYSQVTTILSNVRSIKNGGDNFVHIRILPTGDTTIANQNNNDYYLKSWQRFRSNGYTINRRKVGNNTIERTVHIFPDSVALLNALNNPSLLIDSDAAGILYGVIFDKIDSSQINIDGKPIQINPTNGVNELSQRYAMTAIGAELSYFSARLAGLAWTDSTAKKNTNYEYEILEFGAAGADLSYRSVKVAITNTPLKLVKPETPQAVFSDKKVMLSWKWYDPSISQSNLSYQNAFTSYHIEVSTTSANAQFSRINERPIMSLSDESDSLYYIVPLTSNGVKTFLRIVGISPFGEEVASSVVNGHGVEPSKQWYPRIDSTNLVDGNKAYLHWKFPSDTIDSQASGLLSEFEIYASPTMQNFQKLSIAGVPMITATTSNITIPLTVGQNYYIVTAKYKAGYSLSSSPVLVQKVDSIPPAIPTGLHAVWESESNNIRVSWTGNQESDLQGYKLFRANLANEEPALLGDIKSDVTYLDTLLRIDNPKAWYYVLSYDQRFNQSALSQAAIITKPDIYPPVSPYFTVGKADSTGVKLTWINSISQDVSVYQLSRKPENSRGNVVNLQTWNTPSNDSTWVDNSIELPGRYTYFISASDSSGNVSVDSVTVEVIRSGTVRPQVKNFAASYNAELGVTITWDCVDKNVVQVEIARIVFSSGPTDYALNWKFLDGLSCQTVDKQVFSGQQQRKYGIQAVFADGTRSTEVIVDIQIDSP